MARSSLRSNDYSTSTAPLSPGLKSTAVSGGISRHAGKLFSELEGGGQYRGGPRSPVITATRSPIMDSLHDMTQDQIPDDDLTLALEERLGREEAHELQELFRLVDKDGGGNISQDEFIELLHTMSVRPNPAEMDLMYGELDADGDGVIEYTEFLKFMTQPGVQSANGAALLRAFQIIEGYQYDCGTHHPAESGKTGRGGILNKDDLSACLKTFLPDKLHNDKEVSDLLKHIKFDRNGCFSYKTYIESNVNPATLPPVDAEGRYVFDHSHLKNRRHVKVGSGISITEHLQATAAAATAAAAQAAILQSTPSVPPPSSNEIDATHLAASLSTISLDDTAAPPSHLEGDIPSLPVSSLSPSSDTSQPTTATASRPSTRPSRRSSARVIETTSISGSSSMEPITIPPSHPSSLLGSRAPSKRNTARSSPTMDGSKLSADQPTHPPSTNTTSTPITAASPANSKRNSHR